MNNQKNCAEESPTVLRDFFFFGAIFQLLVVAIFGAGAIFQLLVVAIFGNFSEDWWSEFFLSF